MYIILLIYILKIVKIVIFCKYLKNKLLDSPGYSFNFILELLRYSYIKLLLYDTKFKSINIILKNF
jgi:hypothetical protein